MTREQPRLTGFIRRFGKVSVKPDPEANLVDDRPEVLLIARKKQEEEEAKRRMSVAWSEIKTLLSPERAKGAMEVRKIIKEAMGDEGDAQLLDEVFLHVLDSTFKALKTSHKFSHSLHREMKGFTGGSLTYSAAEKCFSKFLEICQDEDSSDHEIVARILDNILKGPEKPASEFGAGIVFSEPQPRSLRSDDPEFAFLTDLTSDMGFNLHKELTFDLEAAKLHQKALNSSPVSGAGLAIDISWLERQIKNYYGEELPAEMSVAEFALTLVTLLSSKRASDDLQTELFDLMGFDRIELIGLLLEHREDLLKAHVDNKDNIRREIAAAAATDLYRTESVARPSYGCQVLVQSEEERQLRKQVRREEKRIQKLLSKVDDDEDQGFQFSPVELRTKRQEALAVARAQPIFKERKPQDQHQEQQQQSYPFVFDSMSKAKAAAGFIQGVKMVLPAGFERKDDKKFEEVSIPASSSAPVDIGRNLVAINSLDEVGMAAFQGIKTLNRIQSVVCDCAYRTNENMLVCAPTGAGKTNVAMLCVTQTIKQHIENGVVKKDSFKIVYVAPMKALAAEMTANFGKRLAPLGITVRELTGDMQLTKTEIMNTQMLVTTPEKWDVVTRKPGDVALAQLVRLIIIDEVHLLHGDRGPVVEALVARTLRLVESSQTVIRVVGLSATLPNYADVAHFLKVNPYVGLFFFDGRFRPVPLATTFIGVKDPRPMNQMNDINDICYNKVVDFVKKGHQVMVFVHARNATVRTGMFFRELAQNKGQSALFEPEDSSNLGSAKSAVSKSRNRQLVELFSAGFGFHHAGMLRSDRNLVEKLFSQGLIKVLVCTATLAWGVNLPAHAVIIKGTEIYDAKHGTFVDIGILDVLQIFGRAGRPQFDTSGHGTIITSHDKLAHYLSLLTNQFPIESNFVAHLADNLNAEISLGTVTNVDEAVRWLSYSYLYVRMRKNPLVYGITYQELRDDPTLEKKRRDIVVDAARKLDKAKMIRFDERTGYLHACDLGRTASQFYIKYDTVEVFNELLRPTMNEGDLFEVLSKASEFEQLKVRDDELEELDQMVMDNCEVKVVGGPENVHGKVSVLLQTHVSRGRVNSFSLTSDLNYVTQNGTRIARAMFEIVLKRNWPLLAGRTLKFSKMLERQMWDFENPLRQHPGMKFEILEKLERRNFTVDYLREMDPKEIGLLIKNVRAGTDVKKAAHEIPSVNVEATIQPITRTVLRIRLNVTPNFRWNDRVHGATSEPFWLWVEDPENNHIYHSEYLLLTKKQVRTSEIQEIVFTIPIFEPLPTQYYVRAISDRWLGSETYCALSFQHLILPDHHPPHTPLLDLHPLPVKALKQPQFESLYQFDHFNPIQTQIFHTLYHTDKNVLLGAPTGSGKTIAAELAMFKVFRDYPGAKVVYIAPLKALVRERMADWTVRLGEKLGKSCVELTGDVTPDVRAIQESSVIVTTPEKWDGVSRSWQTRNYVQAVALIVIDEIHLLGEDRGPVLEVIVSRTNFIASHTTRKLRVVGLSTALANAKDLADWLGIGMQGLFNFRPSVRPVPLEVHISGFPGKHYCPRMATMNKPCYQAIQQHSPTKPALIFVSSRRQTRLTALDLIAFLAGEDNPKMWLHMDDGEMERITQGIKDQNLRLTLAFGIGMHHAGLMDRDRRTVEELFFNQKIQVLIATATVAWGVNFPAHLVVIKGTEYYDGKLKRYVDMPITDVLQMMGRAGRPQFDDHGVACVLVHDQKKHFYKKFLYEPFPVESSLHNVLPDHLNAEIVAGTVATKQEAMDYLTWTYFFRRLIRNPTYYGLDGLDEHNLNSFLTKMVENTLYTLIDSSCVELGEDERGLEPTTLGRIASYYYMSHESIRLFFDTLNSTSTPAELLKLLSDCQEFAGLPVRHNEDQLNGQLASECPLEVDKYSLDSPHTKTLLLLQAHFQRCQLPCADYLTDTRSVLDQAIRILQAMIDVSADSGWLSTTLNIQSLLQMLIQGRWYESDSSLLTLPHLQAFMLRPWAAQGIECLPQLVHYTGALEPLAVPLRRELDEPQIEDIFEAMKRFPRLSVSLTLRKPGGRGFTIQKETPEMKRGWIKVGTDQEYTLSVQMTRMNPFAREKEGKAYTSRFHKPKDEGWFLVLGCVDDNELLALRRASPLRRKRSSSNELTFFTPVDPGRVVYTLYVVSDAYLGLDQQYQICLDVEEGLEEPAEDLEDDSVRLAMLQREKDKLLKLKQEKRNKDQSSHRSRKDYESLGARPKARKGQ